MRHFFSLFTIVGNLFSDYVATAYYQHGKVCQRINTIYCYKVSLEVCDTVWSIYQCLITASPVLRKAIGWEEPLPTVFWVMIRTSCQCMGHIEENKTTFCTLSKQFNSFKSCLAGVVCTVTNCQTGMLLPSWLNSSTHPHTEEIKQCLRLETLDYKSPSHTLKNNAKTCGHTHTRRQLWQFLWCIYLCTHTQLITWRGKRL